VSISTDKHLTGRSVKDEFGAILGDIRDFGKTTPNDRRRLRDLARAIGWGESGNDPDLVVTREKH